MQKEKRIIYKLNGDSFEIDCEENDIKERILLKFEKDQDSDYDLDLEYQRLGNPQSNTYVIYSLKMLIKQKIDKENNKKEFEKLNEKIIYIEKEKLGQQKYQEVQSYQNQIQSNLETILIQKDEINNLKEKNMQLEIDNEKFKKKVDKLEQEKAQKAAAYEKEYTQNFELNKKLEQTSKELNQIQQLQSQSSESELSQENKMLKLEIANLQQKHENIIQAAIKKQVKQYTLELEQQQQQIEKLQAQLNYNFDDALQNDQLKNQYDKLQNENLNLKQNYAIIQENLEKQKQDYENQINILNKEIEKLVQIINNFQKEKQVYNFSNNIINFKLSEVKLNLNTLSDLSLISQVNLTESPIKEFSEEEFNQAQKEFRSENPFKIQILQFLNLDFELKKKQANEYKNLTQSQIKDQILNNLLCFELIKKYVQENLDLQKKIQIFNYLRIPRQFIIEVSNGIYYYCEELIQGENTLYSINRNNSDLEKMFQQFFIYCFQNTGKKRVFTQLALNQTAKLVSNVIAHDISNSPFNVQEILAQLGSFNQLLNQQFEMSKSLDQTIFIETQLD
ncbi:unnamed protein product [Paramecium sonneborni]|uniref:Uncharacterized protein n=1 Tax=Paramecium sonneborni TaxID=65129 RepID=A0A8S1QMW2_9CILI|nr:unnamed protein product [Paramecium sonneborni]